jgi:hypothetical protein
VGGCYESWGEIVENSAESFLFAPLVQMLLLFLPITEAVVEQFTRKLHCMNNATWIRSCSSAARLVVGDM